LPVSARPSLYRLGVERQRSNDARASTARPALEKRPLQPREIPPSVRDEFSTYTDILHRLSTRCRRVVNLKVSAFDHHRRHAKEVIKAEAFGKRRSITRRVVEPLYRTPSVEFRYDRHDPRIDSGYVRERSLSFKQMFPRNERTFMHNVRNLHAERRAEA